MMYKMKIFRLYLKLSHLNYKKEIKDVNQVTHLRWFQECSVIGQMYLHLYVSCNSTAIEAKYSIYGGSSISISRPYFEINLFVFDLTLLNMKW